jgi:hypothetical protein
MGLILSLCVYFKPGTARTHACHIIYKHLWSRGNIIKIYEQSMILFLWLKEEESLFSLIRMSQCKYFNSELRIVIYRTVWRAFVNIGQLF